jgi:hypothetical protein
LVVASCLSSDMGPPYIDIETGTWPIRQEEAYTFIRIGLRFGLTVSPL